MHPVWMNTWARIGRRKEDTLEVLHPTALLGEPNMCIICEETPKPSEQSVIDTEHTMIAPFSDNVWHKYICEKCGLEIANRLGYISNKQAKAAFDAAEAAANRLNVVREKVLSAAEDIHSFATDVTLGNERSTVGKTVEGEVVEPATLPASEKKAAARKPKVAVGSTSTD